MHNTIASISQIGFIPPSWPRLHSQVIVTLETPPGNVSPSILMTVLMTMLSTEPARSPCGAPADVMFRLWTVKAAPFIRACTMCGSAMKNVSSVASKAAARPALEPIQHHRRRLLQLPGLHKNSRACATQRRVDITNTPWLIKAPY